MCSRFLDKWKDSLVFFIHYRVLICYNLASNRGGCRNDQWCAVSIRINLEGYKYTLNQWWINVGPVSQTVGQHSCMIGLTSSVCCGVGGGCVLYLVTWHDYIINSLVWAYKVLLSTFTVWFCLFWTHVSLNIVFLQMCQFHPSQMYTYLPVVVVITTIVYKSHIFNRLNNLARLYNDCSYRDLCLFYTPIYIFTSLHWWYYTINKL